MEMALNQRFCTVGIPKCGKTAKIDQDFSFEELDRQIGVPSGSPLESDQSRAEKQHA
jgi:hypothetical protein